MYSARKFKAKAWVLSALHIQCSWLAVAKALCACHTSINSIMWMPRKRQQYYVHVYAMQAFKSIICIPRKLSKATCILSKFERQQRLSNASDIYARGVHARKRRRRKAGGLRPTKNKDRQSSGTMVSMVVHVHVNVQCTCTAI